MRIRSTTALLCCLLGLLGERAAAQTLIPTRGREFWFGFMQNYEGGAVKHLYVYISSDVSTTGTMSSPGMGWSQDFSVAPNTVTQLEVPLINAHAGSEVIDTRGVLVETEDTVAVYALNFEQASADAAVIYPTRSLGTEYRVQAYTGLDAFGLNSELLIVATADGTEVEITPTCVTFGGQLAGVPFTIQLNEGESYQVQAAVGTDDLTGTLVRGTEQSGSCRQFAVFSGSRCPNVPITCTFCDHVFEQNLPVPFWGSSYYSVPWMDSDGYTYRVLAGTDNTQVVVDNDPPIVLNAGQFFEVNSTPDAHCFTANHPFSVAQFMQGSSCSGGFSDPALLILNAEEQKINDITFATVVSPNITDQYISVVVDAIDASLVVLDGNPVSSSVFVPFAACASKVYASLSLDQGSHRIQCVNGLAGYVYGLGPNWETYAYSVGGFMPNANGLALDTAFCLEDTTDLITLVSPEVLFNPAWTTQSNPLDTLFEGPSYTFLPTASDVYILSGSTNASDCIQQFFFSVEINAPPTPSILPIPPVCAYTPVTIDLTLAPNGTYVYNWEPDAGLDNSSAQDPMLIPVHSGWYHVDISTLTGCSATEDSVFITVTDGNVLSVQAEADPAFICIGDTSQLDVAVRRIIAEDDFNNGTGPIWQQVQGGAPSTICGAVEGDALRFTDAGNRFARTFPLDVSVGGSISFAIKLANGVAPCDDVDPGENILVEYSINGSSWYIMGNYGSSQFPDFTTIVLPIPSNAQTAATLFRWRQLLNSGAGQDNWMLDDVAIAADDPNGMSFTWSPAATLSNANIHDPLAHPAEAQVYTVSMVDNQTGCAYSDEVELDVGPLFTLAMSNDTALCSPGLIVYLNAQPLETGSYMWHWSPEATLQDPDVQVAEALPQETTYYVVEVSNQFGCTVTDTVLVRVVEALSIETFVVPDVVCEGQPAQLQVQAYEGSGSYVYSWTPPGSLDNATIATPQATPSSTTTYTVFVTDTQCGAQQQAEVLVTVLPAPPVDLGADVDICPDGTVTLTASDAETYLWSTEEVTPSITVEAAGTYWVQAFNGDCIATDTIDVGLAPGPGTLGTTTFNCANDSAVLGIPYLNGTYLWATGDTTQSITVGQVGDYAFTLIDVYGCSYTDVARLLVDPLGAGLVVPNVISPNGDGLNDRFEPMSGGNPRVAVSIYNRYGQEVFTSENLNLTWGGQQNGNNVPEGTYFYVVRYTAACATEEEVQQGTVTVVR